MNDPIPLFVSWYNDAVNKSAVPSIDPAAVSLATASIDGKPSVRMVLFRGLREGGFSFFTNYESRKGQQLASNPFAAMVFYWSWTGRQVRVEGHVKRLSAEESDTYFSSRPVESQVSALISMQSRPLLDEAGFMADLEAAEKSAQERVVTRPDYWGGYTLVPSMVEFWTHGEHRRHQRVLYVHDGDEWKRSRLYP